MVTQKRLKELLTYHEDTGAFIRNSGRGGYAKGTVAGNQRDDYYWRICIDKKLYFAHRLAWLYMTGEWPEYQVDHINHLRFDNRWKNLRQATHQENGKNQILRSTNTSGKMGVSWDKARDKWAVAIKVKSKLIHLGRYTDKEKAIFVRETAEILYGFHKNHGAVCLN